MSWNDSRSLSTKVNCQQVQFRAIRAAISASIFFAITDAAAVTFFFYSNAIRDFEFQWYFLLLAVTDKLYLEHIQKIKISNKFTD